MAGELRRDYRWILVGALYLMAGLGGVVQVISPGGLAAVLNALLFALFSTGWCVEDAYQRGTPLLPIIRKIVFFTWIVSVPIYLIWSRKWRGAGYVLLHTVGLIATEFVFYRVTLYFLYGT